MRSTRNRNYDKTAANDAAATDIADEVAAAAVEGEEEAETQDVEARSAEPVPDIAPEDVAATAVLVVEAEAEATEPVTEPAAETEPVAELQAEIVELAALEDLEFVDLGDLSDDDDAPLLDDELENGIASVFAALHAAAQRGEAGKSDEPEGALSDDEATDGITFRLLGELDRLWHRAA